MSQACVNKQWHEVSLSEINSYQTQSVQPKKFPDEIFELWSVPNFPTDKPEIISGHEIGSSKQSVASQDVLICKINPRINRVWKVGEASEYRKIASSEWIVFRQPIVESRFFLRFFQSAKFRDKLCTDVSGVGGSLTRAQPKKVATFSVPLPPLAEQKVIADTLDTLLAQVDNTKARLERIPEILKCFRQSVLAAAVSGRLTEEWRDNNSNLELFASSIKSLTEFRDRELASLPDQWAWLSFEKVANIASNLVDPSSDPGAIHIAPNHIESGTGFISEYQTVAIDGVTSSKHRFYKGQILYSKIRPYLCKVAVAPFDGLCSADMYPISSKLETNYLYRWMLSLLFTDWASNAGSRSVLPKINQKDLNKIPVPTPPMQEQIEIVRRVDQLFAYADTVECQVNSALARVNQLNQSILARAFRGELTAQWRADNPELISGENSAEALLERIKEERAAQAPTKRTRKKATT